MAGVKNPLSGLYVLVVLGSVVLRDYSRRLLAAGRLQDGFAAGIVLFLRKVLYICKVTIVQYVGISFQVVGTDFFAVPL